MARGARCSCSTANSAAALRWNPLSSLTSSPPLQSTSCSVMPGVGAQGGRQVGRTPWVGGRCKREVAAADPSRPCTALSCKASSPQEGPRSSAGLPGAVRCRPGPNAATRPGKFCKKGRVGRGGEQAGLAWLAGNSAQKLLHSSLNQHHRSLACGEASRHSSNRQLAPPCRHLSTTLSLPPFSPLPGPCTPAPGWWRWQIRSGWSLGRPPAAAEPGPQS